jgi:uncharacterized protein DUF6624
MPLDIFVALKCHSSTSPILRGTFGQRLASRVRALQGSRYLAIFLFVLLSVRTRGADAPSVEPCPGAASWSRSHATFPESPQSEPGSRAISDAALLKELQVRFESDQAVRKKWLADVKSETLARSVGAIDAVNLTWLRQLISEKGFPTAAQVGYEGVHFAWILLQHADQDPKLQSALLPVLEQRFAAGELAANDLARSTDRVLVAGGKPQRYGTQFDWWLSGDFKLPEPRVLAEIDTERSHLGLMPLADYACSIREEREKIIRKEREKMK